MVNIIKRLLRPLYRKITGKNLSIDELVKRGLILGQNVKITGEVIIDPPHCWLIEICDDVVIAPRVMIFAHDASPIQNRATKIGRVKIGKKTFIGAGSIILPGIKIGENVVIGAGTVITHDIPDNSIVVGNPCKIVGNRMESETQHQINLSTMPTYEWPKYGIEGGITISMKEEMKEDLKNTFGYLVND